MLISEQDLQDRLYNINGEISKVSNTIEEMDRNRSIMVNRLRYVDNDIGNLERSLKDMENLKSQRLEILRRKDRDAYSAVLWLRENQHMFSGKVYEPILIEVSYAKDSMLKSAKKNYLLALDNRLNYQVLSYHTKVFN